MSTTVNDYDDPKTCEAVLEMYTSLTPSRLSGLAYVAFGDEGTRITLPPGGHTIGIYVDGRRIGHIDNDHNAIGFGILCALVKLSRISPDNPLIQRALGHASDRPFDLRVTSSSLVKGGQL